MIDHPIGPKTLLTDEEELGLATAAALWLKERGQLQLKRSAKQLVEARGCFFLRQRMASLVMNVCI